MVLYGSIRDTPANLRHPFQAVITDEDGDIVATFSAPTWEAADDLIDAAKFQLHRMMVQSRAKRMT